MATRIASIATATSHDGMTEKGGLALADVAAMDCLAKAYRAPNDIDLLVNAGIYHDRNLGEPALAAMIQEDIHANEDAEHGDAHGTFSFDVANGGSGFLTAAMLVDGFLRSSAIRYGLVVASDANPGHTEGFPYGRTGGAALLCHDEHEGFTDFSLATFPQYRNDYESRVVWHEGSGGFLNPQGGGENRLEFRIREDFLANSAEAAVEATRMFLEARTLGTSDVDLFVPSPFPAGFAERFAAGLGLDASRVVRHAGDETPHTAGPLFGLEAALKDGRFIAARRTLMVTVGAGITVGLGLYVREPLGPPSMS